MTTLYKCHFLTFDCFTCLYGFHLGFSDMSKQREVYMIDEPMSAKQMFIPKDGVDIRSIWCSSHIGSLG